jgi:putative membrane-bound dehydrogenase-like protein
MRFLQASYSAVHWLAVVFVGCFFAATSPHSQAQENSTGQKNSLIQEKSAAAEADSVERDYAAELPRIAPLSPEAAQKEFEILDPFRIELVASEPLVTDPVAFAFDARGRLWVAEMRDYSEQATERLGRVALLTDTDGDGAMDHRQTFVEDLSWPTAIWPWLDGVLVAEPPQLTWYRDRDGDGVADESEVWFSGFGRSNVQGLVNSLRWGLDAWIHGATSSAGAQLHSPLSDSSIDLGRRDFAIDPLTKTIRAASGGGQHGMSFNRWGDKFVTSNSDHLQQIIDMESWLAGRPTSVPFPSVRRSIAQDGPQAEVYRASPVEPWRIVRTRLRASGVVPGVVEGGGRAAGYFTGATGTWIMDHERGFGFGDSAGAPEQDTALVCDVGSNLVHRKRLIDEGLFWTSQRIDPESELLRSRDIWFRPVQLGDGPDGALYIADMYREVIEHPLSLPPVIKKHLDLTSGRDRGRIWRVTSPAIERASSMDLSRMSDAQLVERLAANVSWQRLMASQLLVERSIQGTLTSAATELLKEATITSPGPEARILSLWLLHRLGQFPEDMAGPALQQSHPRVLAHAIDVVAQSGRAKGVQPTLTAIASDARDSRVQLALAKTAAALPESDRMQLLGQLAATSTQPLVQATIAAACGKDSWRLLQADAGESMPDSDYRQWLDLLLPTWIAEANKQSDLSSWLRDSLRSENPRLDLWLFSLASQPSHAAVASLLKNADAQQTVDGLVDEMMTSSSTQRYARLLGLASNYVQAQWMEELIQSSVDEPTQSAAIQAFSWSNHPELTDRLVEQFRGMTPSVQLVALRCLTSRPDRLERLAQALEGQQIHRSQIPPDIRQSLLSGKDPGLSDRFKKSLSQVSADRASTIERYQRAMESMGLSKADTVAGKAVFKNACAQCHRLGDIGNDVGPPLQQLSEKSPLQLLEAILDPSMEVDPKYTAYSILTEDGVVINGLIVQESGNQIVVAEAGGKQTTLDRQSIEQIQSTGLSLMPNGLEEQVTPEQMIDLIGFLLNP